MARAFALAVLLLGACQASPGQDAGSPDVLSPVDAPPPGCLVDTTCPELAPWPGLLCAGALSCPYARSLCTAPEVYDCVEGRWSYTPPPLETCTTPPSPQLGERCRTPFAGTTSGTVALRIVGDAFVIGSQGSAMVDVELDVGSDASTLECIEVSVVVLFDGTPSAIAPRFNMRMRCGHARTYLPAFDLDPGVPGVHDVLVTAEVTGVGSAMASGRLRMVP